MSDPVENGHESIIVRSGLLPLPLRALQGREGAGENEQRLRLVVGLGAGQGKAKNPSIARQPRERSSAVQSQNCGVFGGPAGTASGARVCVRFDEPVARAFRAAWQ